MTDEQFDEMCRNALAFEPGQASKATWSKIRRPRWSWLPTVPEILTCGCACGLALFVLGALSSRNLGHSADSNPVVQKAMVESLAGTRVSSLQVPDATSWTAASISLPQSSSLMADPH